MSGRGKGGRGLGIGGVKRHRMVSHDQIQGITNSAIRRLARCGGVKRISGVVYEETRGVIIDFLKNVIRDAVTCAAHSRRKTVTATDVVYALKRQGRVLYGFGGNGRTDGEIASDVVWTLQRLCLRALLHQIADCIRVFLLHRRERRGGAW
uniref:Histone H4 n=1 Tax=Echinococcus granulosus TaxID=6210 RepID=A0A068W792_ECHGR|nr:histone H4 [Echinococcus granulosus]